MSQYSEHLLRVVQRSLDETTVLLWEAEAANRQLEAHALTKHRAVLAAERTIAALKAENDALVELVRLLTLPCQTDQHLEWRRDALLAMQAGRTIQ